jgi:hypothetical protein
MMSCSIWHITTRSNRSSVFGIPKDLNSSRSHICIGQVAFAVHGSAGRFQPSLFGMSRSWSKISFTASFGSPLAIMIPRMA